MISYITDYWIAKLSITSIFSLFVVLFYTIWLVKVIQHLIQSVKLYRVNKRKDFRDTREQDRVLYNYETHIVKDVILIFLSMAEMAEIVIAFLSGIATTVELMKTYPYNVTEPIHCGLKTIVFEIFQNLRPGSLIAVYLTTFQDSLGSIGFIAFVLLLSFLTEYLSKRYYAHPFYKSILSHFLIFLSQTTIVLICSNEETFIFQIIIAPILVMIDWCILVRNCRKLRSVLKSNVRDLDLHFTHRSLYRQQLKLLQTYTVFMPILLTALFFGVLTVLFHHYLFIVNIMFNNLCTPSSINPSTAINELFSNLQKFGTLILMSIHFLLLGLPMYILSLQMLLSVIIKKFRRNNENFRFNYTNFANLERYHLRSPY